jgi:hypothetical protein
MVPRRRVRLFFVVPILGLLYGGALGQDMPSPNRLPTTREVPNTFGTDVYTVTTVPAVAFYPENSDRAYYTSANWGRFPLTNSDVINFYAALDLPAGAVIDYIGLNSATDTPFVVGAELVRRNVVGGLNVIGGIDSTVHDWGTDFNGASPIGYTWGGASGEALILHVQIANNVSQQFFGWVEIWWKRSVSPAPGFVTFNDVPTNHPFFQFVEALAASGITGGCGNGNYCPDNPVTRGQMAVFLAKALGLQWPAP